MNEQERQVISDIFKRLEQVADQPRDPEAERFIQEKIRQQPYAPYAMAQAIFVQEQALQNLNAQLEALQAENEELRQRPQGGGGILSSLFGGGSREPERPRPAFGQPQQGGPWGGAQPGAGQGGPWAAGQPGGPYAAGGQPGMAPGMGQPGMGPVGGAPGGGSGFLGTALTTAAGVAGGMMLGNALMNAFGGSGGGHGALGGGLGGGLGGSQANAGGSDFSDLSPFGSGGGGGAAGQGNRAFQDANYQDASLNEDEDFGSDMGGDDIGGGDDWA
jgi:uncharacterized protein